MLLFSPRALSYSSMDGIWGLQMFASGLLESSASAINAENDL